MPVVQAEMRTALHAKGVEYLIWLAVPAAGGDGLLLGVVESEIAAKAIVSALNELLGCVHSHSAAI